MDPIENDNELENIFNENPQAVTGMRMRVPLKVVEDHTSKVPRYDSPMRQDSSFPVSGGMKTYSKQNPVNVRPPSVFNSPSRPLSRFVQPSLSSMWARPPPSGTVGLQNLGNTCYINSSLQALLVFDKFLRELLSEENVELADKAVGLGKTSLLSAFRRFWVTARAGGKVLSPGAIKQLISESSSERFGGNQQEDAHEFFSAMLNALDEAWIEATKKKQGPV